MLRSYWRDLKQQWRYLPKGVGPLLIVEMCELYGRFSVVALLVLYLTETLQLADHQAFGLYAGFMTLLYVMPVLGGLMADRILGPVLAVTCGVLLMTGGDILLTIASLHNIELGLVLVVLGSAVFTPTLAGLLHHLYGGRPQDQDTGFMLFYLAKNVGALLAPLVGGVIATQAGYPSAFMASAVVMVAGLVVFLVACQRGYLKIGRPDKRVVDTVLRKPRSMGARLYRHFHPMMWIVAMLVIWVPALLWVLIHHGASWLVIAVVVGVVGFLMWMWRKREMNQATFGQIALTWSVVACFSAFLGQGGTTLSLFIERLVDRTMAGVHLPTSFFFTLDPLFMMTVGPFLFIALGRAVGTMKWTSTLKKYALGLLLLGIGFAIFTVAAMQARTGLVSMFYVVAAYLIFPLAELSLMPIAFSQMTARAPQGLASTMAGLLYLAMGVASYATGRISDLASASLHHSHWGNYANQYQYVFTLSAIACVGLGIILLLLVQFLSRHKYASI